MNINSADLFFSPEKSINNKDLPLAERMRPRTLDEFAGQRHIIGPGKLLRRALSAMEAGALTTPKDKSGFVNFDLAVAEGSIQKKLVLYDRDEDAHYDTASAFIKSMRGSDPDAALYWLAKMLYAGEDPRFIARRICISAAEDAGNADTRTVSRGIMCNKNIFLRLKNIMSRPISDTRPR